MKQDHPPSGVVLHQQRLREGLYDFGVHSIAPGLELLLLKCQHALCQGPVLRSHLHVYGSFNQVLAILAKLCTQLHAAARRQCVL